MDVTGHHQQRFLIASSLIIILFQLPPRHQWRCKRLAAAISSPAQHRTSSCSSWRHYGERWNTEPPADHNNTWNLGPNSCSTIQYSVRHCNLSRHRGKRWSLEMETLLESWLRKALSSARLCKSRRSFVRCDNKNDNIATAVKPKASTTIFQQAS